VVSYVKTKEGVLRVELVIKKQELVDIFSNGLLNGKTMEDLLVEV